MNVRLAADCRSRANTRDDAGETVTEEEEEEEEAAVGRGENVYTEDEEEEAESVPEAEGDTTVVITEADDGRELVEELAECDWSFD